jgi:hypothetical protein
MRGLCLDRSRRLWLHYAWVPGITKAQGEDSGAWLNLRYGADVSASYQLRRLLRHQWRPQFGRRDRI